MGLEKPIILTSLPKPKALLDTVKEIAAAKLKGKLVAEMSTFTISDKEKAERVLRKAGHTLIDCPVSGTGSQAKNRDLVFYASGDTKAIARLRPVLITVGATVFGLVPLALHGGPLWEPLCYAQIGGLTLATFITLLLVPVLYSIFVLDLKLVKW
jgi:6-phosphogluconate dehydrogenase (decarboxylating)